MLALREGHFIQNIRFLDSVQVTRGSGLEVWPLFLALKDPLYLGFLIRKFGNQISVKFWRLKWVIFVYKSVYIFKVPIALLGSFLGLAQACILSDALPEYSLLCDPAIS